MRLKTATLEFLANELHLEAAAITAEASFAEVGVDAAALPDLLHRLQDALGIILPEDKVDNLVSVGDLLDLVEEQDTELA